MIARIETEALFPLKPNRFFRTSAIYAIKKLTLLGYTIEIGNEKLSAEQQHLLEQEEIEYHAPTDKAFDILITLDGGQLQLHRQHISESWNATHWLDIASYIEYPPKKAHVSRKTKETKINIDLNLYGTGKSTITTGLGFFDHMLDQIAKHALVDLDISCQGDLHIDEHHTIEDVGIALGEALSKAIGDKKGMERFGFVLPMDETQARIAMDLSGRPFLVFKGKFKREYVGNLPTEMVEHFFYSLAMNLKATLHIQVKGDNDHHKVEACFKGFARCLRSALERNARVLNQIPSSKGTL